MFKTILYYFDKLTAWLDFSWMVTNNKNKGTSEVEQINNDAVSTTEPDLNSPPSYTTLKFDPLLQ
jgi:hypothetical protein